MDGENRKIKKAASANASASSGGKVQKEVKAKGRPSKAESIMAQDANAGVNVTGELSYILWW